MKGHQREATADRKYGREGFQPRGFSMARFDTVLSMAPAKHEVTDDHHTQPAGKDERWNPRSVPMVALEDGKTPHDDGRAKEGDLGSQTT